MVDTSLAEKRIIEVWWLGPAGGDVSRYIFANILKYVPLLRQIFPTDERL